MNFHISSSFQSGYAENVQTLVVLGSFDSVQAHGQSVRNVDTQFGVTVWCCHDLRNRLCLLACLFSHAESSRIYAVRNTRRKFVRPLGDCLRGDTDRFCRRSHGSSKKFECFGFVHACNVSTLTSRIQARLPTPSFGAVSIAFHCIDTFRAH